MCAKILHINYNPISYQENFPISIKKTIGEVEIRERIETFKITTFIRLAGILETWFLWFGFIFNGIPTVVGYLMTKPPLYKDSSGTI